MTALTPGLVSVMMPAYNAAPFIEEAIASALAQTYPDWELLVVDDGSTDATAALARRFDDPRIRVFSKESGGESSARNMALERGTGEFLAFLDADDAFEPDHLDGAVAFLRTHPDCDAVYTDGVHIDERGARLASLQSRRRGPFQGRLYEEVVRASDVFGPPGCTVLRHEVVAGHRLRYDRRIVIGPDWDFFARFADIGTFGYLPARTYLYRVHQSNITAQVDDRRRAGYLAICRENAIAMPAFATCSLETRSAIFYDLLVNQLRGRTERRAAALGSPAFQALPAPERARLLRLVAAAAMGEPDAAGVPVGAGWTWRRRRTAPTGGPRRWRACTG